jgi:predicted MFS family arabinose efflux permease
MVIVDLRSGSTQTGQGQAISTSRLRIAMLLLGLAVFINITDRQVISILAESIKRDLSLTDTQVGLSVGFTFSIFYVLSGVPISRFIDRGDRVRVMSITMLVWCLMTALCGVAPSFLWLVFARMGVAVGEAGPLPCLWS